MKTKARYYCDYEQAVKLHTFKMGMSSICGINQDKDGWHVWWPVLEPEAPRSYPVMPEKLLETLSGLWPKRFVWKR